MADIQHVNIPDEYLHETKGAANASAGTWLGANGNGTATFQDLPGIDLIVTDSISTESTSDQLLSTVNTETKLTFGPTTNSPNGSISVDANGDITVNEDGLYYISGRAFAGRTSSVGVSILGFAQRVDGVQQGATVPVLLDANTDSGTVVVTEGDVTYIPAGTVITYHMRLFANGGGDNGIIASTWATSGWNDTPSVRVSINKLGATQ